MDIATRPEMAVSPNWSAVRALAELAKLPERLDDQQLAMVDRMANLPCPALPLCSRGDVEDALLVLMATLPKQASGEADGVLRVEGYLHTLGPMPKKQLDFMRDEALRTCEWMPAPATLERIAQRWQRADDATTALGRAAIRARQERQFRLDDARRALRFGTLEQARIDVLSDRIKSILEAEGLLWRCECGSYCARPHQFDAAQ